MRRATALAGASLVLLAGSLKAASNASVTITDAAIAPKTARVAVNGTVTWKNAGTRIHAVASLTGAFSAFALQPGKTKSIRFSRSGSHPYVVDGTRCAYVVAGGGPAETGCNVIAGAGGQPPPSPPPPSGVEKKTVRYDIRVIASLHTIEVFSGYTDPAYNGTLDRDLSWTGSWRRIELEVQTVGDASYLTAKQATVTRGTISGKLEYSDSRPYSGPCSGDVNYAPAKARAIVSGGKPDRGKRYVNFDASVVNPSAIDALTSSKQKAACNENDLGLPHWSDESRLIVQGVDIHHPPGASIHPMDTRWSREAPTGTPFPLDRFLAGRGFTLDSGIRTSRTSRTGYSEKFTGRVKYVFTLAR